VKPDRHSQSKVLTNFS